MKAPRTLARLSSFSVRQRITAAVALLTALALTGAGFAVYAVQMQRLDEQIETQIDQEIGEFRALQKAGVDPRTGKPFTSADRLLEVFLDNNLPDENEVLLAFSSSGQVRYQGEIDSDQLRSPTFTETVAELRPAGGSRTVTIDSTRYVVNVQPVHAGEARAAFVVVHNLSAARQEIRNVIGTYAVVASVAFILITALASSLAGRLLRPVRRLRETAGQIADGDLSQRIEVTGNDDLTELSATFNVMLDRLEAAFGSQRQLLDDVGHELRTPLTILRGHLELVDLDNPDEVATTRRLLLDETDRMTRLVDDLLVLAKARRPDFIQPSTVDLATLTQGLLDKCRALGDRTWTIDNEADAHAMIDGQRLTQAVLQLADNAVRHTGADDEIGIGSRTVGASTSEGEMVEFWVRDTGPGIPQEEREHVFERFKRGSSASSEDGFGLGLSIVSAIATAHGGTVRLDAASGAGGATFRIRVRAQSMNLSREMVQ